MSQELSMLKSYTDIWWLIVLRGLFSVLIGIFALAMPTKTLATITIIVGLLVLVDGVISIFSSLMHHKQNKNWWVGVMQGVFGVLIGLFVFNFPGPTIGLLLFIVALWAIISAIIYIVVALSIRNKEYGGWFLTALAVISFIFGVIAFANPYETVKVLTMLVGILALVSGIFMTAFGMEVRSVKKDLDKILSK